MKTFKVGDKVAVLAEVTEVMGNYLMVKIAGWQSPCSRRVDVLTDNTVKLNEANEQIPVLLQYLNNIAPINIKVKRSCFVAEVVELNGTDETYYKWLQDLGSSGIRKL